MKSQESEHKRIIVPILPTLLWIKNSKKNSSKIKKIKKHHSSFISSQIGLGKDEKVSKKKLSFQSFHPNLESRIPKKIAKKFKKIKNIILALFLAKPGQGMPRKKKKIGMIYSYQNRARAFPKRKKANKFK